MKLITPTKPVSEVINNIKRITIRLLIEKRKYRFVNKETLKPFDLFIILTNHGHRVKKLLYYGDDTYLDKHKFIISEEKIGDKTYIVEQFSLPISEFGKYYDAMKQIQIVLVNYDGVKQNKGTPPTHCGAYRLEVIYTNTEDESTVYKLKIANPNIENNVFCIGKINYVDNKELVLSSNTSQFKTCVIDTDFIMQQFVD